MHGNGDEEWKRSRAETEGRATEMLLVREGESLGRSLEIRRLTTFFETEEISVKRLCRVSREPGVSARHIRVDALAATTIPQRQHFFHSNSSTLFASYTLHSCPPSSTTSSSSPSEALFASVRATRQSTDHDENAA